MDPYSKEHISNFLSVVSPSVVDPDGNDLPLQKEGKSAKKLKKNVRIASIEENDDNANKVNIPKRLPYSKNSRKSRNGLHGRGFPKKGGAGGKHTWGVPGSEIDANNEQIKFRDPNYDSGSDEQIEFAEVAPEISLEEIEKSVGDLVKEYIDNGDIDEVVDVLVEMKLHPKHRHLITVIAVSIGMERHEPQREMISCLISDLVYLYLTQSNVIDGFKELLSNLNDLVLDTPEAPQLLGKYIARAVADDALPPRFVQGYQASIECPYIRDALKKADILLSLPHGIVRLDNVWGVGGGIRPVKYLIDRVMMLLKEYLSSSDVNEATQCLKELDVPHFHHELVYEALLTIIEDGSNDVMDKIIFLLKQMSATNVITPHNLSNGCKRIFDDLPEICIDCPGAYSSLQLIGTKMTAAGLESNDFFEDSGRGRKRFVSEGDGGFLKN